MEIFHLSKSMDIEKSIFASFSSTRDDHPKKQIRPSFPKIPSSSSSSSSSSSLNHPKDHLDSLKEEESSSPPSIVQVNAMDTSRVNKTRVSSSSKLQFKNKHSIPCSTPSSSSRSLSHEISILSTHEDDEEEDQDEIKVKKSYFLRDLYLYTSSLLYTNYNNNYLELFFSLFNYNQNDMNYSYLNRNNGDNSNSHNHSHNHHHISHTNRSRTEGAIYLSSLSSRCKSLQKEIRFLERESEEGYYENVYLHQLYEQSVYSKTQFGRVVYMFAYFLR